MSRPFSSIVAVMYHYIQEPGTHGATLPGLTPDALRRQVERLLAVYDPVTPDDLRDFFRPDAAPVPSGERRSGVVFTFDDGLKEHRTVVAPMLHEMGVVGHFFASPRVLETPVVLPVHRRHILAGRLGPEAFRDEFLEELRGTIGPFDFDALAPREKAFHHHRWGTPEERQFKYLLNYVLDQATYYATVDALFVRHVADEAALSRQFYLSPDDMRAMRDTYGQEVGGHGYSHEVYGRMDEADQKEDVRRCRAVLSDVLGAGDLTFSYPYGKRDSAYNDATIMLLKEAGFYCGFSTEVGPNRRGVDTGIYDIRRIDTNDVDAFLAGPDA